jgi:hypothetical protein
MQIDILLKQKEIKNAPYFAVPYLSHLTSCTPTEPYIYLTISLATAVTDLDL